MELSLAGTNFHGPKPVQATEVLLYFHFLTLEVLTLKGPITTATDNIHKYFFIVFFFFFLEKIRLDVSCESSARQRIHMKNQALFISKEKSKKLKCRLLQFFV